MPGTTDSLRFEARLRSIERERPSRKIFLLGSSQTRQGLDAERLNQALKEKNWRFYNLGVSSYLPADLFMDKEKLLRQKPDLCVLLLSVRSFYEPYNYTALRSNFNPSILGPMLRDLGLREMLRHYPYFVDAFLGNFFVLYRYRGAFAQVFWNAAGHFTGTNPWPGVVNFLPDTKWDEAKYSRAVKSSPHRYYASPYTKLNRHLFAAFVKELNKERIPLMVIDIPSHRALKKCYASHLDVTYRFFLAEQSRKLNFTVLGPRELPAISDEDFEGFSHLNEAGRLKLTAFLRHYLEKSPSFQFNSSTPGKIRRYGFHGARTKLP